MSTVTTWQTASSSSDETERLGERLGQNLRGGEVIELVSDLGGGKTTLVRGLARGFGSTDRVASPTFTVSKVYTAGGKELHHLDFYRLQDAGVVAYEVAELVHDPDVVVVVEWAGAVHDVLPVDRLAILIARTGEETRELTIAYPPALAYMMKGLA